MFFFFFSKLNEYILAGKEIIVFQGELVDIQTVDFTLKFFNSLGCNVLFFDNIFDVSVDFLNDFFFDIFFYIDIMNVVVFVSLNLRVEFPLLNSRFNKLRNKIRFYCFGVFGFCVSSFIKNVGNSIFDLVKFLYGSHYLNRILFYNSFYFSSFFLNRKIFGIYFFFGMSFSFNTVSFLFKQLKLFVTTKFVDSHCLNLIVSVGMLNFLSVIRLKNVKNKLYYENSFLWFENVLKFDMSKCIGNFIVYRGLYFDEKILNYNLIIPMLSFFESDLKFCNFIGIVNNTNKVVSSVEHILTNNDFFGCLFFFRDLLFKKYVYAFFPLRKLLKFFLFLNIDFVCLDYKLDFDFFLFFDKFPFIVCNYLFSSYIINYYKSDIYSKNSKNLTLASFEYLINLNVYL